MNRWKLSTIALALALGASLARAAPQDPHVAGAKESLTTARRHLEALPRTDARDHALLHTQDALKAIAELPK